MSVEIAKAIADKAEMSGAVVHPKVQGPKGQWCLASKEALVFLYDIAKYAVCCLSVLGNLSNCPAERAWGSFGGRGPKAHFTQKGRCTQSI